MARGGPQAPPAPEGADPEAFDAAPGKAWDCAPHLLYGGYFSLILYTTQGQFVWQVSSHAYVPLLTFYAEEHGWGVMGAAYILASLQVGWLLVLPLRQRLTAWVGPRRTVVYAMLLIAATQFLILWSEDIWTLLFIRVIDGMLMSIILPLLDSQLSMGLPATVRGQGLGWRNVLGSSGKVYGMLASFALHPLGGLPAVLLGIAFLCTAWACFSLYYPPKDEAPIQPLRVTWNRRDAALHVLNVLNWFATAAMYVLAPVYLQSAEYSMGVVATIWFVLDIARFPVNIVGGWLADSLEPFGLLIAGMALQLALLLGVVAVCLHTDIVVPGGDMLLMTLGGGFLLVGTTMGGLYSPAFGKEIAATAEPDSAWTLAHLGVAVGITGGSLLGGYLWTLVPQPEAALVELGKSGDIIQFGLEHGRHALSLPEELNGLSQAMDRDVLGLGLLAADRTMQVVRRVTKLATT